MSFLGKGKKADLIKLAIELGECESSCEEVKIIELRTKILTNDAYKEDPEFVKCIFEGIVSNRIDEENKQKEETLREFELQKIRLQNEAQRVVGPQTLTQTKIELKKLLPTFNPEVDNMDLFLPLFERQMKLLDLGEYLWVPYLIGDLPSDVTSLIFREPEEKCRDYSHIRGMLLQQFKLTAEIFRELFSCHRKIPNGTWKDCYFEIRAYFEGWLNEPKIDSFDGLKNLMIADQMKKRCSPECKEHYLNIWEELISPEMLADKQEDFDNIRRSLPSGPRRYVKASEIVNDGRQVSFRKHERPPKREYSHQVPYERSPLRCYGCGKHGVIKARCPTCNLNASQRTNVATKHINAYTAQTRSPRLTLIDITFCGIKGRVCKGTGSSHSIAGERMFQIFMDKGLLFRETTLAMSLADGQQTTGETLTTQVMVEIEGRSVLTKFIILPKAKGNRTLLGTDFLSSAGLVLDVKNTYWYFSDNPTHKYPFGEELDTPSIVEKMPSNTCQLREEDLKPRLAILVQDKHDCWSEKLPFIRFALNTAKCETTGQTAAFLNFSRELRTPSEVVNDIRVDIQNDNFVPEITPYLKKFAKFSTQIREVVEKQQDSRKFYADKKRKAAPTYQPGEHVFVASHPLSQGRSAKLMPRRDGPYVILTQRSPSSYEIASLDNPGVPLGVYHTSALTPCNIDKVKPLIPLRKRGRPPNVPQSPGSSSGRRRNQRGRICYNLKKRPPPQPRIEITTVGDLYAYLEAEKMRYFGMGHQEFCDMKTVISSKPDMEYQEGCGIKTVISSHPDMEHQEAVI
ncbi:uncharacterized protein TNCV_2490961 [Trichonephila clavipes]|nr:uncharacterized protein TNCV_2490961 [Trichonephila clavipes]